MNIRTQLRAGTFATTFFLVLFIIILLVIASSVWHATDQQKVADQFTERSFQLSLLRSEYLLHPGERAKIQWIGQSESKLRLIDEKAHLFTNDIERGLVEKLRMAADSNRLLFAQLVRSVEQGGIDTVIQELNNQMNMRSQISIQLP